MSEQIPPAFDEPLGDGGDQASPLQALEEQEAIGADPLDADSADASDDPLDAQAHQPVHVVATTGQVVDVEELAVPNNAYVVPFADHEQLLRRASLVVGHGGHATTMRTLRAGVPMVAMRDGAVLGADAVESVLR